MDEDKKAKRTNVRRIIRELESLPTFPDVLIKLEDEMRDSQSSAGSIAKVVERDMALAGRLLKVANSAYYGSSYGEITDIRQAVTRLGQREIRMLAVAVTLIRAFPDSAHHVDPIEFWKHSLAAAGASRSLAGFQPSERVNAEEGYTAGLLHDVGWLVIDQFLPVDVFAAGCPPRPENLFNALIELQKKVDASSVLDYRDRKEPIIVS